MPARQKHKLPPLVELEKLLEEHKQEDVARMFNMPANTLSARISRLRRIAREEILGGMPLEAPEVPERPVDDPVRVRVSQLEDALKQAKSENRDYAKALAKQEEFFDRIVAATSEPVKAPKYRVAKPTPRRYSNSVIAPVYDQQFGQFVRADDTPGNRGSFSVEVFDKRLEHYVNAVTGIMAQRAQGYSLNELILVLGGDHVEGDEIFPGQAWQLELDPPRQVWELASKMESALREIIRFSKEELGIPKVGLYGVTGNHGAVGGRRGGARPATYNWDWLFLKILMERLRAEPIDDQAIEPGGALFFRAAGHEFQAVHGDEVKGWGGLPYYGLTRFHGRSQSLHGRVYRVLLMGHHHQAAEIPNGTTETIVSGDWVGANNLSKMMTAASRPQQRVLFVSERWGVDGTERIYFAEADEAFEPTEVREL